MPSLDAAPAPAPVVADLSALVAAEAPVVEEAPPALEAFPEPVSIAPPEPTFDAVDIDTWDSSFDADWSQEAAVFVPDPAPRDAGVMQEDVEWKTGDEVGPRTAQEVPLPSAAAMKRMKKGELVALAEARGVDSSGTKTASLARLLE